MGDWAIRLLADGGYFGLFGLMLLETIFPPIPSELIMSLAGVEAARGVMSLPGAIAAGTAGAMVGNTGWYAVARVLGGTRFRGWIERHGRWLTLDWATVEAAERGFRRYGGWFVGLGRLLPTVRSLVSIPAGLFAMPLGSFLLWSTLGSAGWNTALAIAGQQLGRHFRDIDHWVGPISIAVLVVAVGAYLLRLATWRRG